MCIISGVLLVVSGDRGDWADPEHALLDAGFHDRSTPAEFTQHTVAKRAQNDPAVNYASGTPLFAKVGLPTTTSIVVGDDHDQVQSLTLTLSRRGSSFVADPASIQGIFDAFTQETTTHLTRGTRQSPRTPPGTPLS